MPAAQGILLDPQALVGRGEGACVPGSHKTVTIRETIPRRLPPTGHYTDNRQKHIPRFSMRDLLASAGVSDIGTDYRLGMHLKAMEGLLGNIGWVCHLCNLLHYNS